MNKWIVLACLMLGVTHSFGTTLVWGVSGAVQYKNEDGPGSTVLSNGDAVAYLVYLGKNVSSWNQNVPMTQIPGMFYEDFVVAAKPTDAAGRIGTDNHFTVTPGVAIGGISGISQTLVSGRSTFGVLFITSEPIGGLVRYYYGDIVTFNTSSPNYTAGTDTFLFNGTRSPGPDDVWDYSFIPEPATASLSLLGLVMLIRRRK